MRRTRMTRQITINTALAAITLGALGASHTPAGAARRPAAPPAKINAATVRPANLPGAGGSVTVDVSVPPTRPGVVVQSVRVSASTPGSTSSYGPPVEMTKISLTYWRGTISIVPNP